jgi:uncharacterized protein with HEPN domain
LTPQDLARKKVKDALGSLELLKERLQGVDLAKLMADPVLMDACAYRICVVGEAIDHAKGKASAEFARVSIENTTWDGLVAIRNAFIHEYAKVTAEAILMFKTLIVAVENGLGRVLGLL